MLFANVSCKVCSISLKYRLRFLECRENHLLVFTLILIFDRVEWNAENNEVLVMTDLRAVGTEKHEKLNKQLNS